jgi:hypothetical protein
MKNDPRLILLSAIFLAAAVSVNLAGTPAYAISGKSAEADRTGGRDTAAKPEIMTLEPFYLIQEQGDKVWIERVIMTFKLDQSQKVSIDPDHPKQRSMLFDILASESEPDALPAKVQTAINQALGIPAISSVHLSRSFLLL